MTKNHDPQDLLTACLQGRTVAVGGLVLDPQLTGPVFGPVQRPVPGLGPIFGPNQGLPFLGLQVRTPQPLPAVVKALLERPVSYYAERAAVRRVSNRAPLTHVAFALDCSSSMEKGKSITIEGFNRQAAAVKEGASNVGETRFTEVLFGDRAQVRQVAADLSTLVLLTETNYVPDGCTALYDGLGMTIAALLQTEGIDDPSTACLVTVFTDGGENNSSQYDAATLKELILRLEATGRWTFALVGPQGAVSTLAELLAVQPGNVKAYDPGSVESRQMAFNTVVGASASYMTARSQGMTSMRSLYAGE